MGVFVNSKKDDVPMGRIKGNTLNHKKTRNIVICDNIDGL